MIEMSDMTCPRCVGDSLRTPVQRKIVGVLRVDNTLTAEGLLWLVASAGQMSDDPLVQSIVTYAYEHQMRLARPSNPQAASDGVLRAVVDGRDVRFGARSMLPAGCAVPDRVRVQLQLLEVAGYAIRYAAVDDVPAGIIVLGEDGPDEVHNSH